MKKAREYLDGNQPGPAALVLDALTVVLLPADSERYFIAYSRVVHHVSKSRKLSGKLCRCLGMVVNTEDAI